MLTDEQFTCVAETYIDMVYRIALNYVKNPPDAEDVCQTVFLQLLTEKKPFSGEVHIRSWLIRVTVNACKKLLRSPWNRRQPMEETVPASLEQEEHRELYRAVMELPARYRLPLYLHYYEGYSTAEIGSLLSMPKGTVCTRLYRAKELLKTKLRGDEA